ncbi:olfactory receptor 52K1-like [Gadus morhua]|uniref:olfactory receptor 52K1-like n=1 Tax=Gadus morhua TaxID=8049 RepID=UPI0011B5F0D7|nr:olfactory receptor 52K1-like [Gadus morhua]
MTNVSELGVTTFTMASFSGMESLNSVYFCLFFFLYIVIIVENTSLIGLIVLQKSLHEPMYLLVCNLAANGLYGSTALLPAMLKHILSRSHQVTLSSCLLQVFTVHTYAIVEFTILAAMSYDRYVAICRPLHYHTAMPLSKVYKIITLTWLLPFVAFLAMFSLTLNLRFCQPVMERLYCLNYSLVRLSCSDTGYMNIVGIVSVFLYTVPQIVLIFYTYGHILKICVFSSRESQSKALRTCTPHLLTLVNYAIGCFFEIAQSRFELSHLTFESRSFMSLYFLIFPPILNPAIYGMSIQRIRAPVLRIFNGKRKIPAKP